MEQKLISFEETDKLVEAAAVSKAIDICSGYKIVRPILLFVKPFLKPSWKEALEAFMKLMDTNCQIQS